MPLVYKVAHQVARHLPAWIEVDDLISAGSLGLLSAADRFDPARGTNFGVFARYRIKFAILDELRSLDQVPRRSRQRLRQFDKARQELTGENGCPPDEAEMADHLGLPIEKYRSLANGLTPGFELSIDLLDKGVGSMFLCDYVRYAAPDQALAQKELRNRLIEAINQLPKRMRSIISLYYYARLNYREIAIIFGITESRICQIHSEAVNRMRSCLECDEECLPPIMARKELSRLRT